MPVPFWGLQCAVNHKVIQHVIKISLLDVEKRIRSQTICHLLIAALNPHQSLFKSQSISLYAFP
jgi:hypothetical protein